MSNRYQQYSSSASLYYPYSPPNSSPVSPTSFSPASNTQQTPSPTYLAPSTPESYHSSSSQTARGPSGTHFTLKDLADPLPGQKPSYKDKILVQYALQGFPDFTASARDIVNAIADRFEYYREDEKREKLKAFVRQRLSFYPQFVLKKRPGDGTGYWTYEPSRERRSPGTGGNEDEGPSASSSHGVASGRDRAVVPESQASYHQGGLFDNPYMQSQGHYPPATAPYPAAYPGQAQAGYPANPAYQYPTASAAQQAQYLYHPQTGVQMLPVDPNAMFHPGQGNPYGYPTQQQASGMSGEGYIDPRLLSNTSGRSSTGYPQYPAQHPHRNQHYGGSK